MAKQQTESEEQTLIRQSLDQGTAMLGMKRAIRALRRKEASRVFITSNMPSWVVEDIKHYGQIGGVDVTELPMTNRELGTLCKKPFLVSALTIRK